MKPPEERQDSRLMRAMFTTIAPRYDFVTRLFSYGMDRRWKRRGVERLTERSALPPDAMVLDLASGTGDFSQLVRQRLPRATPVAVDLTEKMVRLARERGLNEAICADALHLPFPDSTFHCVFVGYGLRNFPDLKAGLAEIARVTRPGGLMVSLDFFLPANPLLRRLYLSYLYLQGGLWGLLLHGRPRVYTYIPDSLRSFLSIKEFSSLLKRMGYPEVEARAYILGGIGLHWATKAGFTAES
jgi:demethylmenaquinone methyltransferase / 2-methoxy-6-polyprenyl-1,4-benzoquinol methylase